MSCILNAIPSEWCFITEQYAMKDQAVYKHHLATLNTNIPNIDLFGIRRFGKLLWYSSNAALPSPAINPTLLQRIVTFDS
jgi:hypothetical protein